MLNIIEVKQIVLLLLGENVLRILLTCGLRQKLWVYFRMQLRAKKIEKTSSETFKRIVTFAWNIHVVHAVHRP